MYGSSILIILWICFALCLIVHGISQRRDVLELVRREVKAAGGRVESIEHIPWFSRNGRTEFEVVYRDSEGRQMHRQCIVVYTGFGSVDKLFWEGVGPHRTSAVAEQPFARLSTAHYVGSKEQIISDLDAEVQRLQAQLAEVRQGG